MLADEKEASKSTMDKRDENNDNGKGREMIQRETGNGIKAIEWYVVKKKNDNR